MAEKSNIGWTDSTCNFWSGCTKVSAGCKNCYAETRDKRHMIERVDHFGKGAARLRHVGAVKNALAMNRKPWICDTCGEAYPDTMRDGAFELCPACLRKNGESKLHRRRVFSLSLGDWLDAEVPIEWLAEMLHTVQLCDKVTWILCTKRPENWKERLAMALTTVMTHGPATDDRFKSAKMVESWLNGTPPKNVVLLASVENQEQADKRIPLLLEIPAACRGLSLEPLLGPVDLKLSARSFGFPQHITEEGHAVGMPQGLHWLIPGCESGPGRRDCDGAWVRHLVEQGKTAGVAVFVKQILVGGQVSHDPTQWPEWARVQRWPNGF